MISNKLISGISGVGKTTMYMYETIKKEVKEGRNFIAFCRVFEIPAYIIDILLEYQYSVVITGVESMTQGHEAHPAIEKKVAIFIDIEECFHADYGVALNTTLESILKEYLNLNQKGEEFIPTTIFLDDMLMCNKFENLLNYMMLLRCTTLHFILMVQSLSELQKMYSEEFINTILGHQLAEIIAMRREGIRREGNPSDFVEQQLISEKKTKIVCFDRIQSLPHKAFLSREYTQT